MAESISPGMGYALGGGLQALGTWYAANKQYDLGKQQIAHDIEKTNKSTKLQIAQYNINQARLRGLAALMSGRAQNAFETRLYTQQQPQYNSNLFKNSSDVVSAYKDIRAKGLSRYFADNNITDATERANIAKDFNTINAIRQQALTDTKAQLAKQDRYKNLNYQEYKVNG